ncbi:FxSxx-COOH system tetratricopeptide repeat protein [Crossiella sp. CA-258035]|uniref:FxSxx-COOH system tetratricopeptide repeat protein n=1 Tax=Crossiella sp. CA-258035 TaxID=2981138 RepID=UPI0024BC1A95|nr:FxSxx-COOH system tetratricopeptide repeat protein [Crossiella sp. CA-258035]WHT17406.1 FxSxx-COOH system tetratricopeptide repeat protein [Crossiella sp. CA-258035]
MPPRASAFQRRLVAAQLSAVSAAHGTAVLVGSCSHLVRGLGGVGKTQLAAEHARTLWNNDALDVLVWVAASSRDAILTAYAHAATAPDGPMTDTPAETGIEIIAQRWLQWLASTRRRWLVVLDDVQDPADVVGLWPPHCPHGQVVVTTRRRDAALASDGRHLVDVDAFTPEESRDFLATRLGGRPEQAEGAAELAEHLHHLPIALAQAAAYIADRPVLTCTGYLARWNDQHTPLAKVLPAPGELPDEHRETMATIWALSIAHADAIAPVGLARPLLEILSLLDAHGVPDTLLNTPAVLAHLGEVRGRAVTANDALDALGCLHRLNLITHQATAAHRSVRVHALIQRTTRETLTPHQLATTARLAADALIQFWPRHDGIGDSDLAVALRGSVSALRTHAEPALWHNGAHPVLLAFADSLARTGRLSAAISCYRRLLPTAVERLGTHHADTLTLRHNLAHLQGELGDVPAATAALTMVLADRIRVLGPDHPDTLNTRHNLAYRLGAGGDAAGAAACFASLLTDRMRVLGADHPDTLTTAHNTAAWQGEAGDPAAAAAAFARVLSARARVLGPEHPSTLSSLAGLGHWLGEAGDPHAAVRVHTDLLARTEHTLGPNHLDTLAARHALAQWLCRADNPSGAALVFTELLTQQRQALGPDHPDTLTTGNNLAHCLAAAGDPAGAAEAFAQLIHRMHHVLGAEHPNVLTARCNLATALGQAGNRAAAVRHLHEVLVDVEHACGTTHPSAFTTANNLAHWQGTAGDPAGAAERLQTLVASMEAVLGTTHPDTLTTSENLAHWLDQTGDHTTADTIRHRLRSHQDNTRGQGSINHNHAPPALGQLGPEVGPAKQR